MNVSEEHIDKKSRKVIGSLKGKPVIQLRTTGGLFMVVCAKSGGFDVLGTGPHRAVARHIAMKQNPELQVEELSKSDYVDPIHFAWMVPEYEALTARMNE